MTGSGRCATWAAPMGPMSTAGGGAGAGEARGGGAQPGVSRSSRENVSLAGAEAGMDSSIMHTMPSSEDSMVLAVPEPAAAAMNNLKVLYQLGAALGSSFDAD